MENKKEGRNCQQGIEADSKNQESNSLAVKENNREGFRFITPKMSEWKENGKFYIEIDHKERFDSLGE